MPMLGTYGRNEFVYEEISFYEANCIPVRIKKIAGSLETTPK
jgi:hypothetical protein